MVCLCTFPFCMVDLRLCQCACVSMSTLPGFWPTVSVALGWLMKLIAAMEQVLGHPVASLDVTITKHGTRHLYSRTWRAQTRLTGLRQLEQKQKGIAMLTNLAWVSSGRARGETFESTTPAELAPCLPA